MTCKVKHKALHTIRGPDECGLSSYYSLYSLDSDLPKHAELEFRTAKLPLSPGEPKLSMRLPSRLKVLI
jgi:hypothetical protein